MIITFKRNTPTAQIEKVEAELLQQNIMITKAITSGCNVLIVNGDLSFLDDSYFAANTFIHSFHKTTEPYQLVNRRYHPQDSVVNVGGVNIGGNYPIVVIAGPCTVESKERLEDIATCVQKDGASILRGGAYKPRTSPYDFQGLGKEALIYLKEASKLTGMPVVSELMSSSRAELFEEYVDLIQIGARNMQNFDLLKTVGKMNKPIMLKRGLANTIEEWILSAEYIMSQGNGNIILCERGIRTFEKYTRNTLDLSVIPIIKEKTHLPIIIDPSHASGDWKLVETHCLAAVAAGADGLMIEVHTNPEAALCDGAQSLLPEKFRATMNKCRRVASAIDREM